MKKCNCEPGYFLCPKAVKLWEEVNRRYKAGDWKAYEKALDKYNEHIKKVEKSK